jgi:hypothetical protein
MKIIWMFLRQPHHGNSGIAQTSSLQSCHGFRGKTHSADETVSDCELDEMSYRKTVWVNQPLTDSGEWGRVSQRSSKKTVMFTMGDVARCSVHDEDNYISSSQERGDADRPCVGLEPTHRSINAYDRVPTV